MLNLFHCRACSKTIFHREYCIHRQMPSTMTPMPNTTNHRPNATKIISALIIVGVCWLAGCTQEQKNQLGRNIQNWTGTNGVLEVYAGEKLVRRFIKIDKLSTAFGTDDKVPRPYRYGYGVLDENLNMQADPEEKKVYFEISDYSSNYIFFENPR